METHNVCGSRSDILKLIRTQINDPPAIPMSTTMSIQIMFHQDLQKETEVCWFVSRVYATDCRFGIGHRGDFTDRKGEGVLIKGVKEDNIERT